MGQKLAGAGIPSARPRGSYLVEFAGELRSLREEQEPRSTSGLSGVADSSGNAPPYGLSRCDSISSTLVRGRPGSILSRAASTLRRNPSQRIGARDGSKCLERYANSQAPNQANLPGKCVDKEEVLVRGIRRLLGFTVTSLCVCRFNVRDTDQRIRSDVLTGTIIDFSNDSFVCLFVLFVCNAQRSLFSLVR